MSTIGCGERLCVFAVGILVGRASVTSDIPAHLVPVYMAIAACILLARWAVVSYRNRRDARS